MATTEARIDLGFRPHAFQLEIMRALWTYRFAVLVAHRRFGKTLLSIMTLMDRALRCKLSNPRYAYVAPRLKQAKQIAWMYLVDKAMRIPGSRKNEGELYVELPNSARITLYGASDGNEEAMRGLYLDGTVVDEVAGIAPHVWGEIMRPALADRKGWAMFIGTPHGVDTFHALYQQARSDEAWYTGLYRVDETQLPWLPKAELELARRAMSDAAYRQEFLCDFTASAENVLITIDLVSAAAARIYRESEYGFAPTVMGVDVARFGDDRSVIQMRQGLLAYPPLVYKGLDNMALVGKCTEAITKYKPDGIFVDAGGGAGVIDRLRQLGHPIMEVNFGGKPIDEHYQDKRTEMWFGIRHWLEQGGAIPNEVDLKSDLSGPTYEFTAAGKVRLEPKDDLKARGLPSPDLGDALALTFAMPVHVMPLRSPEQSYALADDSGFS
jgi:hypothetical protein